MKQPRLLLAALLVYSTASLLHFTHNAEYLADYPNLPQWLSRAVIYQTWFGIFLVGLAGYLLFRRGRVVPGLLLLVIYTALGFDGLLHYGRAPLSAHTPAMHMTIWLEVIAAAAALSQVVVAILGVSAERAGSGGR